MIPSVLSSQLIQGVKDFLTTTFPSTTPLFFDAMDHFLHGDGNLFKGPYISVALPFRKGSKNERFFPDILGEDFSPYYHQELAFRRLGGESPQSTIVATGTGSGKTESFMYPILDYCYHYKSQKGIKAIIIYPMNALATDQAKRFAKTITKSSALHGIRVGLFVGSSEESPQTQMSDEYVITDKNILRQNPPDILLTNYKMLDFLLMRPKDQTLWQHNIGTNSLRFLAVDEIHTFDGAQGSDLASLLRRLRAKLEIPKEHLACIGTSATLGTGGSEAIRTFAGTVFSETFNEDSVVTEYRISADEFFESVENDYLNFPDVNNAEVLNYRNYPSIETYIAAQYKLWFYDDVTDVRNEAFRLQLGRKLKELSLFKLLLKTLNGKIVSRIQLIEAMKRRIHQGRAADIYYGALVDSLLSLTSWARGDKLGSHIPPFLHVRSQLWLRELTRMVGSLEHEPKIRYSHDISIKDEMKHYPLVHCRDCHAMGWGGVKKEGTGELLNDLDLFYQSFFAHDPRLKFIFPVDDNFQSRSGRVYRIDVATGCEIYDSSSDINALLVYEPDNINQFHKSHNDCPFCNSKNSLTILGSRAASLTSVLIGQSYASSYNDDKKFITFSDSVQDAAHRAGFFGARSYQFTLRSAIQQALIGTKSQEIPLDKVSTKVREYWSQHLASDEEYVATLIAPDMEWLRDYEQLQKQGKLPVGSDIINLINQRIDWAIYSEYGYKSHIGRTLERSGASVAFVHGYEEAVDELLPRLQNEIEMLRIITREQLEKFIFGFLIHLKKQGAFFSSHLGQYVSSGGNIFAFTPYQKIYMPSFTKRSRSPQFLTAGNVPAFETIHNKTFTTWCDQWLLDNFMDENVLVGGYLPIIYDLVLKTLIKHTIVQEKEAVGQSVWGLNSSNVSVTTDISKLQCNKCRDVLTVSAIQVATAESMRCMRKGCQGEYHLVAESDDYYRDLYSYGDLQRIVTEEHTGLLGREQREWVENSFIKRKSNEPWKPNLLSATPTLEMGIDIGDLSSVILCSVPPSGSNYLQRIGRAGRTDGNSFNATIANGSDHDLYFYSDPDAMMQGSIEAPGVFIDASAILQRQFMAFCIDHWATEKKVKESEIPYKLSAVLDAVKKKLQDRFPFTLIDYIQDHSKLLLEQFFRLYDGELQESTKDQLRLFAQGSAEEVRLKNEPDELKESMSLAYKLLNRIEQVINERNALAIKIDALRKKIKELRSAEAKDLDHEEKVEDHEKELSGLKQVLGFLRAKDTFEFFTNEGLLPNYAFPETGVILKSIIYRQKEAKQDEGGRKYENLVFEYERSGSSAINELAPHNSFYSGGRKVTVDQIDMTVSEVETWRFCDKCSHTERESSELSDQCPKCASNMWSDSGQKRQLIRMRQVIANTNDRSSRLKDDSDQRDPAFYTKQLLINFEKEQIQDAYAIENLEMPFGFEFIQKVQFKDINFGELSLIGEEVSIAGKRIPRNGFVICRHCGKVQEGNITDDKFKPKHAFSCTAEDTKNPDNFIESLYLYREFSSEAIRLMLPITTMAISDEKLHSLIAAFQMGLKAYFKGSVDHLKVSVYDETEAEEQYKRRYLVLYDAIPGGTGYLRQLMRDSKPLFEVLDRAYEKLMTCRCNEDHTKDGCYQCLYAYKNNFDRPLISREKAKEIIKAILSCQDSVKKVDSVSTVPTNGLFDSELEERFLSELGNYSKGSYQSKLKQIITSRHRTGFLFEIGNMSYEVEQQVEIGEKDGASFPSKADFVIYPLRNNELKPIVVFTDGFAYHKDRLHTDTAQRMALSMSNKYIVWTLTWEDVFQRSQRQPQYEFMNFLTQPYLNEGAYRAFNDEKLYLNQSSFDWLMEFLSEGSIQRWEKRAQSCAVSLLQQSMLQVDSPVWDEITSLINVSMADVLVDLSPKYLLGSHVEEDFVLKVLGNLEQINKKNIENTVVLMQLKDATNEMKMGRWAGIVRIFNLFQFMNYHFLSSEKGIQNYMYEDIICNNANEVPSVDYNDWNGIYEEVLDEAKTLVKKLSKAQMPIPEVGYEICDFKGMVVAEAELAWPNLAIAVSLEPAEEIEGWDIFHVSEEEKIIELIKQKGAK